MGAGDGITLHRPTGREHCGRPNMRIPDRPVTRNGRFRGAPRARRGGRVLGRPQPPTRSPGHRNRGMKPRGAHRGSRRPERSRSLLCVGPASVSGVPCNATVAELVDAQDLGSCGVTRGGSSPSGRIRAEPGGTPLSSAPRPRGNRGARPGPAAAPYSPPPWRRSRYHETPRRRGATTSGRIGRSRGQPRRG